VYHLSMQILRDSPFEAGQYRTWHEMCMRSYKRRHEDLNFSDLRTSSFRNLRFLSVGTVCTRTYPRWGRGHVLIYSLA
jgi:hypothetical protein